MLGRLENDPEPLQGRHSFHGLLVLDLVQAPKTRAPSDVTEQQISDRRHFELLACVLASDVTGALTATALSALLAVFATALAEGFAEVFCSDTSAGEWLF